MSILDEIRQEGGSATPPSNIISSTPNTDGVISPTIQEVQPLDVNKVKPIVLTPEQRADVDKVKNALNFMDAKSVQGLDDGINQKLASFNSQMLQRAKMSEVGDMSPLILDVVQHVKKMDPSILKNADGSPKKGIFKLFGKAKSSIETYRAQFETVEKHFDHIVQLLYQDVEKQKQALDNMDQLYAINYQQYCDLKILLVAGREKLEEIHKDVLPKLEAEAVGNSDSYAVQTYQQAVSAAHRLEKKIDDMNLLRLDTLQTATIIQIIEANALSQIESTTQTANGAIQQWKRSVTIALTLRDQKAAAERDAMVRDMNNHMRERTAELLGDVTIKVAENNERSIIDFATLEKVNASLLNTMQRVTEIQANGRQRRAGERSKVENLETQLRQSVLANSQNQRQNHLTHSGSQGVNSSVSTLPSNRLNYK